MPRPSSARAAATLLFVLPLLPLAAACDSGAEKANTNGAAVNANAANANGGNANAANANAAAGNANAAGAGVAAAKVNLNTASADELRARVPGIGDRMIHEFEEYRPYRSIQQFRREIGKYVSPAQVAEYEKYVFVPISENDSDAATLQQIPGLDAAEAEALVAARPYASREAFLTKLAEKVSAEELATARAYVSAR
jgi:DNA uptake protein ComE-like DNA-binding protein